MSYSDALLMWEGIQMGLYGPVSHAANEYRLQRTVFEAGLMAVTPHMKKNARMPKYPIFEELYQHHQNVANMKKRKKRKELSFGAQAALALPGAPPHLLQRAMAEWEEG